MLAQPLRYCFRLTAAFAILVAFCAPALVTPRLTEVKSWAYQLQNVDPEEIKGSPYDLVVIDYGGDQRNANAFPREVLELMRTRPDGRRRLLFAYLSIGEAESYRYYWRDDWAKARPEWLEPENPDWPGNYLVRYWHPEWHGILYGSPNAYLDRILDAGFDGIYIDGADKFEQWKRRRPTAAADMADLIAGMAGYARGVRKDFLVIAQNGDGLLGNPKFLRTIDGFAREDLLYGEKEPEARNSQRSITDTMRQLRRLAAAGVPVFVVEYTTSPDRAASMLREIRELGLVGYVAARDLKSLSPPAFGCGQPDCSQ
ncbi:MAG TPA: MJ1477/TM1410 family putative glycoside hydrolase [Xanthobacteraceae bacterium]|nr:MJ1477/TM1410 family putative glycoside hydrolase [Xanthobacteraceae bacterium]